VGVNLSDLPKDVRERIEAEHGVTARAAGPRAKPSRREVGEWTPGVCTGPHGCGETFARYPQWERHATGQDRCCGRWEAILDGQGSGQP
jgi:hypothetical protein